MSRLLLVIDSVVLSVGNITAAHTSSLLTGFFDTLIECGVHVHNTRTWPPSIKNSENTKYSKTIPEYKHIYPTTLQNSLYESVQIKQCIVSPLCSLLNAASIERVMRRRNRRFGSGQERCKSCFLHNYVPNVMIWRGVARNVSPVYILHNMTVWLKRNVFVLVYAIANVLHGWSK